MKIGQLPLKIFLFIVINDLLDTGAQLLIKKGLGTSDLDSVQAFLTHLINPANPYIWMFWAGLIIIVSNFFLWMNILSKTDLSVALPLGSSSYILVPVAAVIFLHERLKPAGWLGLVAIVLGIHFVSKSEPSKSLGGES